MTNISDIFLGGVVMKVYQNIVVGFGKGGKTLAKTLANNGQEVLVIEASAQMYGGTCINVGCLPSKNLIINGQAGLSFEEASRQKRALTEKLRLKNYHMIADLPTATILTGQAKFISNYELEVTKLDGSRERVRGERIFINTGATPVVPKVAGLNLSDRIVTSKEAMDWTEKPTKLIIIGAGYIGLEFASMFNSYGTEVTVIDSGKQILKKEDDDVSQLVTADLKASGIDFKLDVKLEKVEEVVGGVELFLSNGEVLRAPKVLVATGRKPNTANLGLENTDIILTDKGAIRVDEYLRTNVENIWALGDVNGGPQFTYISLDDFRIVKDQLFGNGQKSLKDRLLVPYTAFITPPLSSVGLKEKEVAQLGYDYQILKLPVNGIPKAHVAGDSRGLFKIIVSKESNQILGATLYGLESHEVINLITLAMKAGLPYQELGQLIYTHPTMSESLNDLLGWVIA